MLIEFDKEADQTNQLEILVPFIVNNLMIYYMPHQSPPSEDNKQDQSQQQQGQLSFVQNNYLESNGNINEPISLSNRCIYSFIRIMYKKGIIQKERIIESLKNYNLQNKSLNIFFLPEITEVNPKNISSLTMINANQND